MGLFGRIKKRKQTANSRIEKCVLCHADTEYTFDTPIDEREFYVEGVGQLCWRCQLKLLNESEGLHEVRGADEIPHIVNNPKKRG